MLIMQALAERLSEEPLRERTLSSVELRVSRMAMFDLLCELDAGRFNVRPTDKAKRTFAIHDKEGYYAFRFKLDEGLPGTSFMLKLKGGKLKAES